MNKVVEGRKFTARVADGWLVGEDAGEWGGGLAWFSEDGREHYPIAGGPLSNALFFVSSGDRLYVAQGLCHLALDSGTLSLVEQDRHTGRWALHGRVDLRACPHAAAVEPDGSLLVVTSKLLRISPAGIKTVILDAPGWSGLVPNSATLSGSGTLYVGMRQRIARISGLSTVPRIEWLVPPAGTPREAFSGKTDGM